jgi:hypothetical protein
MADPSQDPKFHSVDPAQLQQVSLEDIEAGNLFPGQVLIESKPEILRGPDLHPKSHSPYFVVPDLNGDAG